MMRRRILSYFDSVAHTGFEEKHWSFQPYCLCGSVIMHTVTYLWFSNTLSPILHDENVSWSFGAIVATGFFILFYFVCVWGFLVQNPYNALCAIEVPADALEEVQAIIDAAPQVTYVRFGKARAIEDHEKS